MTNINNKSQVEKSATIERLHRAILNKNSGLSMCEIQRRSSEDGKGRNGTGWAYRTIHRVLNQEYYNQEIIDYATKLLQESVKKDVEVIKNADSVLALFEQQIAA